MKPSEFFCTIKALEPADLDLPMKAIDGHERAVMVVESLQQAALVDFEMLTGLTDWPREPQTPLERRHRQAFLLLLEAAALRLKKVRTAIKAPEVHNPDVLQNSAFNLDIVRVIGRAERGVVQSARKIIHGHMWLANLVGEDAQR